MAHLRKVFGKNVRIHGELAGCSQAAFADHLGYARSYISRVETGKANPCLDAVEAFAAALEVAPDSLLRDAKSKRPAQGGTCSRSRNPHRQAIKYWHNAPSARAEERSNGRS